MPNKEAPTLYRYSEAFGLRPSARVLKSLIEQERIPVLSEVLEGSKRVVYCYVPSADTKPGDFIGTYPGGRYFVSPTGETRGKPDFFVLTPKQAAKLEERITVFEAEVTPQK